MELKKVIEDVYQMKLNILDSKHYLLSKDVKEQYIDRECWKYLIAEYLEYHISGAEYFGYMRDLDAFKFPQFTIENALYWMNGFQKIINRQENK